jgi:basic amino acid/polyamine antiporter, APA family
MSNTPATSRPNLLRALGPLTATAMVVGTVIGSGVFKKPQVVAQNVPYSGLAALVWILGGTLALFGGLALAEIAVLYPRAGGNYVFLREGYGRLAGFLWGWVEFWIIRSASIAALAIILAESLADILRNPAFQESTGLNLGAEPLAFWGRCWLTIAVILGLGAVNTLGVKWGGLLQLFITIIKIGSLIGIAALPFFAASLRPGQLVPKPETANLLPIWPSSGGFSLSSFGGALVGVIWAYHGWMNVAPLAEEIRNPQRNIPIALLGGILIIITLYLSANAGYYLIISQPDMANIRDTTVVSEFCSRLLGPIGSAAASAAVMCSVFGALNGNLVAGPRLLYAMGADGLAPRALAEVHPRFRTPVVAIMVLATWSASLVLAGAILTANRLPTFDVAGHTIDLNVPKDKTLFDMMTDFAMFGAVSFEALAISTIFAFRRRFPDAPRPYRCIGYPVTPILYICIMMMVLCNMFLTQRTEALAGLGFIALGAVVFPFIRKPRTSPLEPV